MREKISACITTYNEEENVRRCIESIKWADEIIVVDSFSTDNTLKICREYTDKVYQHKWLGYIGQKNLIKDMAQGPWILFIDADEELSPALQKQILNEFESGNSLNYAGYAFPRKVWFLNRWIKHGDWYPDIKLRLFRKDKGKCGGQEPHDKTIVDGPVKTLTGEMYHYTYNDIAEQIATVNRFSSITADGWYKEKKRFLLANLIFRPFLRFIRGYFLKLGFLDGTAGFIIAYISSFGVFAKNAKLWEHYFGKDTSNQLNASTSPSSNETKEQT